MVLMPKTMEIKKKKEEKQQKLVKVLMLMYS